MQRLISPCFAPSFNFSQFLESRLEFIQQNILYVVMAVISGALTIFSFLIRPPSQKSVSPNQVTQLINREDALVLDVREAGEYSAGHLTDSRNIPLAQLVDRASELDRFKTVPVIVVCQTGARSGGAVKQLEKLDFANVHDLAGGVNAWREAGLPLKKGSKK